MRIKTDKKGLIRVLGGLADIYSVAYGEKITCSMNKVIDSIISTNEKEICVYISGTLAFSSLNMKNGVIKKSLRIYKEPGVYDIWDL